MVDDNDSDRNDSMSLTSNKSILKSNNEDGMVKQQYKKVGNKKIFISDDECQTTLMVFPHILSLEEKAVVRADISVQTSVTCCPAGSVSEILPKLKTYRAHDGMEATSTKETSMISLIKDLIEEVEHSNAHLFDPIESGPDEIKEITSLSDEEEIMHVPDGTGDSTGGAEEGPEQRDEIKDLLDNMVDTASAKPAAGNVCVCKVPNIIVNIVVNNFIDASKSAELNQEQLKSALQVTVCQNIGDKSTPIACKCIIQNTSESIPTSGLPTNDIGNTLENAPENAPEESELADTENPKNPNCTCKAVVKKPHCPQTCKELKEGGNSCAVDSGGEPETTDVAQPETTGEPQPETTAEAMPETTDEASPETTDIPEAAETADQPDLPKTEKSEAPQSTPEVPETTDKSCNICKETCCPCGGGEKPKEEGQISSEAAPTSSEPDNNKALDQNEPSKENKCCQNPKCKCEELRRQLGLKGKSMSESSVDKMKTINEQGVGTADIQKKTDVETADIQKETDLGTTDIQKENVLDNRGTQTICFSPNKEDSIIEIKKPICECKKSSQGRSESPPRRIPCPHKPDRSKMDIPPCSCPKPPKDRSVSPESKYVPCPHISQSTSNLRSVKMDKPCTCPKTSQGRSVSPTRNYNDSPVFPCPVKMNKPSCTCPKSASKSNLKKESPVKMDKPSCTCSKQLPDRSQSPTRSAVPCPHQSKSKSILKKESPVKADKSACTCTSMRFNAAPSPRVKTVDTGTVPCPYLSRKVEPATSTMECECDPVTPISSFTYMDKNCYFEPYMDELTDQVKAPCAVGPETIETIEPEIKESHSKLLFKQKGCYIEPYAGGAYIAVQDNVEVQTELALGPRLLSTSLNSMTEDEYDTCSEGPESARSRSQSICQCESVVQGIVDLPWDTMMLTPKANIAIAPVEDKEPLPTLSSMEVKFDLFEGPFRSDVKFEKKKTGGCCGCCQNEEIYFPAPPPLPPLEPMPPKLSLVFGKPFCINEPYTLRLRRDYPMVPANTSPCTSKTEFPWGDILLPSETRIRAIPTLSNDDSCLCDSSPSVYERHGHAGMSCSQPAMSTLYGASSSRTVQLLPSGPSSYASTRFPPTSSMSVVLAPSCLSSASGKQRTRLVLKRSKSYDSRSACSSATGSPTKKSTIIRTTASTKGMAAPYDSTIRTKISLKSLSKDKASKVKINLNNNDSNSNTRVTCKYRNANLRPSTTSNNAKLASSYSVPALPCSCKASSQRPPSTQASSMQIPCSKCKVPEPIELPCSRCKLPGDTLERLPPCAPKRPSISTFGVKPDPVVQALMSCEAEMRPLKQALNLVQQKLRNLNMPELDCILNKQDDFDAPAARSKRSFKSTASFRMGASTSTVRTTLKFKNPTNFSRPQTPGTDNTSAYTSPSCAPSMYQSASRYSSKMYTSGRSNPRVPPNSASRSKSPYKSHTKRGYSAELDSPCSSKSSVKMSSKIPTRKKSKTKHISYKGDSRCGICAPPSTSCVPTSSSDWSSGTDSRPHSREKGRQCSNGSHNHGSRSSVLGSSSSQCPFLEAIKSIIVVDTKKSQRGSCSSGLGGKKNLHLHLRLRPSQCTRKR